MLDHKNSKNNTEHKKSKIPYFFFAFFAVIFLVNISFIYISKKTWHGISVKDAYKKGLNYNDTIAASKKQKELGWSLDISYKTTSSKRALISLDLRDKSAKVIQGAEMIISFKNNTDENVDFSLPVTNDGGYYFADVSFPTVGQWNMEVVVLKDENEFRKSKRYVIR